MISKEKTKQNKKRNEEIIRLYLRRKKSLSLERIGQKFGLTKQRVMQIIKNARSTQ